MTEHQHIVKNILINRWNLSKSHDRWPNKTYAKLKPNFEKWNPEISIAMLELSSWCQTLILGLLLNICGKEY